MLVGSIALLFTASACGGSGTEPAADDEPSKPASSETTDLSGVCPKTVVVQTNWYPQAEYGGLYQLLDEDPDVDTGNKSVSAPLVVEGEETGVRLEIRSGGPANDYTPAAKLLYLEDDVLLGGADIDQVVRFTADQPVVSVFAPMDVAPLALMWDPKAHPEFDSIADIGRSGTDVLYFQGSTYMDYLVGSGVLKKSQIDPSYDGSPARFVAEEGKVVQQGYITNELYQYETELPEWGRKLKYELVGEAGYPYYTETFTVRRDRKDELAPCLEKLVPMLQTGTRAYADDPEPTNALISELVEDFDGFPYSPERAANAVEVMKRSGVLGNGHNAAVGDFEAARVEKVAEIVQPIFEDQGVKLPDDLGELYTNEFIDTSIGLSQ